MAGLGPTAASGDVARRLGRTAQQMSTVQRLIDKSVIVAVGERELTFVTPGFRSFALHQERRTVEGLTAAADDRPPLELDL